MQTHELHTVILVVSSRAMIHHDDSSQCNHTWLETSCFHWGVQLIVRISWPWAWRRIQALVRSLEQAVQVVLNRIAQDISHIQNVQHAILAASRAEGFRIQALENRLAALEAQVAGLRTIDLLDP